MSQYIVEDPGKGSGYALLVGLVRRAQTNVVVRQELKTQLRATLEREAGRKISDAEFAEAQKLVRAEGI